MCLFSRKKETKSSKIGVFVSHFNYIVSNEQIDIGNLLTVQKGYCTLTE